MSFALTGLGPFFAKHSQGDALGFRMAPRWGLGHCPAGELGKGAIGMAGLEPNGEMPRDQPRLPSPNGEIPRDEPSLPSPNGTPCESPGHRPRSYTHLN